jgi:cytoskeletal protein CcmA (bactofilin family)
VVIQSSSATTPGIPLPPPSPADRTAIEPASPAPQGQTDSAPASLSVIGADLAISGQDVRITSKGRIRVEGKIRGDVRGSEVVIGDAGEVEGVVTGDTIRVFGMIMGTIRGVQVAIEAGAKVEADVHHQTLSIDARAQIEGRVRRTKDISELRTSTQAPETDPATAADQTSQSAPSLQQRKGRLSS